MYRLARSLIAADAVTPDALARALLSSATQGTTLVRALLATRAIDAARLEAHLSRDIAPCIPHVAAAPELLRRLPAGLCERLLALPVRHDPLTGMTDVAVVDPSDPHPAAEIGHWLKVPVRTVRASIASIEAALRRASGTGHEGLRALAPPIWMPSGADAPRPRAHTPALGSPAMADKTGAIESRSGSAFDRINPAFHANIPFALTRKSVALTEAVEVGAPGRRGQPGAPVLDKRAGTTLAREDADGSEEPVTVPGPFHRVEARATCASEDVSAILDQIRVARDRDAILELLLVGTSTIARRGAVLAVKRGALVGWTCSPDFAARAAFQTVHFEAPGTALAHALEHEAARVVRIPLDARHAPLLRPMNRPPAKDVALVAVRVEGRPVAVVLADEPSDHGEAIACLEELARVAGMAMADVLRRRRG